MKLTNYPLSSNDNFTTFEFTSEGTKGLIHKLVRFESTNIKNVFNLAFGDKDTQTGFVDDEVVSNNGDSDKVLASVVATVYAFTDQYPNAWVYATGSTKSRTRLYRMGISKFLTEANEDFEILGEKDGNWENFNNNIDFDGFFVRRKRKKTITL